MLKHLVAFVLLCAFAHASKSVSAQTETGTDARPHEIHDKSQTGKSPTSAIKKSFVTRGADSRTTNPAGGNDQLTYPPPTIKVVDPPAKPLPWLLRDRIAWSANLVLVIFGYVGILIAIQILRTIQRQVKSIESIAQAAVEAATSSTMNAQAAINSERPWIVVGVNRSGESLNSFEISATNKGRTPAEIIDCPDRVAIAIDERHLPKKIDDVADQVSALSFPILLLPGESAIIQRFGRGDLKWICKTEESHRRIERLEESIFIYGSVIYRDLTMNEGKRNHKTSWCCRYIHRESASELVMSGPFGYTSHT